MQSTAAQIDTTSQDTVPVLLQTRRNACQMLNIGLTKCDDLIAKGVLETVRLGRHVHITTESIYRAAKFGTDAK